MNLILFLKGFLMGICDIVPGISGGTIAFITGVYKQLMESVSNLASFKFIKKDILFLLTLGSGIISAVILGSWAIIYLMETFPQVTLSFFIGLVIASSHLIYTRIKVKSSLVFAFPGLIIGILLSFLIPAQTLPTLPYIFLGGFVAISAMFLPGISGAFILLVMGLYENMINALHDIDVKVIAVFLAGAALGAVAISKIVIFMLKRFYSQTLSLLLGLVLGCLLIPLKQISLASLPNISFMIVGALIVVLISRIQK